MFLVHGYSVCSTAAYGQLHRQLQARGFNAQQVQLGRYISLDDDIEVRDLARAMDRAIREVLRPLPTGTPFHMLTHSTGAVIARHWLLEHYDLRRYPRSRLGNLVMLAGPLFGSRLAHHGRSVIARAWRGGDTGRRILDALELGSSYSWKMNLRLAADPGFFSSRGIRPYCITGDRTSRDLLRNVSLARERGSDEVVRAAAANLNFRHYLFDMLRNQQFDPLRPQARLEGVPLAVLRGYTHSGNRNSILQSISAVPPPAWEIDWESQDDSRLNLKLIVHLLESGTDEASYIANRELLQGLTECESGRLTDFAQIQLRLRDRDGRPLEDYFVEFGRLGQRSTTDSHGIQSGRPCITQSPAISHVHRNRRDGNLLTLFIDRSQLERREAYGMRICTGPHLNLAYSPGDHEADSVATISGADLLDQLLPRHSTTLLDVVLDRVPLRRLFCFDDASGAVEVHEAGPGRGSVEPQAVLRRPYHVRWGRDGRIVRDGLD